MTKRTVTVAVKDGAPVTRTQWWTRYGPVVTSLGADAAAALVGHDGVRAQRPQRGEPARLRHRARLRQGALHGGRPARPCGRTQGLPWVNTIAADSAGHTLFTQSQVLPRITDELAQRCSTPAGQGHVPGVGCRGPGRLARRLRARLATPDAVQPGIFGPVEDADAEGRAVRGELQRQRLAGQRGPAADRLRAGLRHRRHPAVDAHPRRDRGRGGDGGQGRADRRRPAAAAVREPGAGGDLAVGGRGAGVRRAAGRHGDGQ